MSENNSQVVSTLLITGLLAILGTVTGEVLKGYWSTKLADKDFQSKLILDALKSDGIEERKQALEFLVTTNLIFDSKIRKGISKSIEDGNVPQFKSDGFSTVSSTPGVSVIPSAMKQIITQDQTLKNSTLILVGLKVRHGDIIDSITPIFAEITSDLKVKRKIEGPIFGGLGGEEILLEHEGYIVTGIKLYRGYYFGGDEVIHIKVIWNRLTKQGINASDKKVSAKLGSGEFATLHSERELIVDSGNYISDIQSKTSFHASGKTFLRDMNIQQQKLPLKN